MLLWKETSSWQTYRFWGVQETDSSSSAKPSVVKQGSLRLPQDEEGSTNAKMDGKFKKGFPGATPSLRIRLYVFKEGISLIIYNPILGMGLRASILRIFGRGLDSGGEKSSTRGVLLYEMLFATTPFTGRWFFFGGGEFFWGKATAGRARPVVCLQRITTLIRYPKWQWTSWKLEDIPSFAKIPKHHQKEQLSSSSWFSSSLNVSESPQLHSPVGRSSSRQPAYHATCCDICPANEDQQWDNRKLAQ